MLTSTTADKQGFWPASNEYVTIFSAFSYDPVANIAAPAPPFPDFNPCEDLSTAPNASDPDPFGAGSYYVLSQLEMTESGDDSAQDVESTREVDDRRRAHNTKVTLGMSREQLRQHHQGQQKTLRPMLSSLESSGQVVEDGPVIPRPFFSPLARAPSVVPHGPALGISTHFNPIPYNWGLNGNQHPASHVIREDEWHGGSEVIQQRLHKNGAQPMKSTITQDITAEVGVVVESKDSKDRKEARK